MVKSKRYTLTFSDTTCLNIFLTLTIGYSIYFSSFICEKEICLSSLQYFLGTSVLALTAGILATLVTFGGIIVLFDLDSE